tara:strand:+ start:4927 stop:6117 length:1191 start_codon:yes stop_codon:yes gene_type:complete
MYGRTSDASGAGFGERSAPTTGGSDGTNKQWLPIWSGEVMTAYDQYRAFSALTESRTIASGRVAEFPIMGTVALKPAWGAGEELLGNTNDNTSKTIAVELDARPIATHFELDNIDLMISQWEYRSELARQAGQTLANARDLQVGAYLVRASAEGVLADDPRLQTVASGWRNSLADSPIYADAAFAALGAGTDAERSDAALLLLSKMEDFMVHLQEIDADTAGVFCAVSPRIFHDIRALGVARENAELFAGSNRPFFGGVAEAGGLGAQLTDGLAGLQDRLEYMGVTIIKTNHMPDFNAVNADVIGEARYNLQFATAGVKAIMWQPKAVAQLSGTGLKVDTVDDIRRNTTFTVASVMAGTGVLRPECASVVTSMAAGTTKAEFRTQLGMTKEFINTP